jgi:hypothetical protein
MAPGAPLTGTQRARIYQAGGLFDGLGDGLGDQVVDIGVRVWRRGQRRRPSAKNAPTPLHKPITRPRANDGFLRCDVDDLTRLTSTERQHQPQPHILSWVKVTDPLRDRQLILLSAARQAA